MFRVALLCVGRLKPGPERTLADRYLERASLAGRAIGIAVDQREIAESRSRRAQDRKHEEATAIRAEIDAGDPFLALDETGDALDSGSFARLLGTTRDHGVTGLAILIGGADGLDPDLRDGAVRRIAFGAMTWPHQLVRIMAAEQLYRAVTILAGHPYHRT